EKADEIVLVHAVPGNADRADERRAAIDRKAPGKDLDAVRRTRERGAAAGAGHGQVGEQAADDEVEREPGVERAPLSEWQRERSGPARVDAIWQERPRQIADGARAVGSRSRQRGKAGRRIRIGEKQRGARFL